MRVCTSHFSAFLFVFNLKNYNMTKIAFEYSPAWFLFESIFSDLLGDFTQFILFKPQFKKTGNLLVQIIIRSRKHLKKKKNFSFQKIIKMYELLGKWVFINEPVWENKRSRVMEEGRQTKWGMVGLLLCALGWFPFGWFAVTAFPACFEQPWTAAANTHACASVPALTLVPDAVALMNTHQNTHVRKLIS